MGDDDDDDGDEGIDRRRRDQGASRSSSLCHSRSALWSDRSAHLEDGAVAGSEGAVEIFSVMGKHLVFWGVEGHESG